MLRPPPRELLAAAAARYFLEGTWSEATLDDLERRLTELMADRPRWRGWVSASIANPVGVGYAWREDRRPEHIGPDVLDIALLLLAVRTPGVVALPYTPPVLVGSWELERSSDAPRVVWHLAADGTFRAEGGDERFVRWAAHRHGPLHQLWLYDHATRRTHRSLLVLEVGATALVIDRLRGSRASADRFRRVDGG